ncbi:MAG: hypothetical protein IJ099_06865 [Alphaproteobacteria bacterium]|nr:hypothetical protein [Alphaproteobacteria bacterium]
MQMRNSGKQFDFSNKELALIYDYMVDTGKTNGLTKAIENILNRKGAQLVENPYKHLSSKTPEKYQWNFVNDDHAISWLQDYLDDNHKKEDGKYTLKAQNLLKLINKQRRRIGADNIEWNFRWNNSDESSYNTFVLRELLQKMQNKDETLPDDISSLSSESLKTLHDNLSESLIEQESNKMKGIYRSIRGLIEAGLRVRHNERAQQKKEIKSQNNQTSLGNTVTATEASEPASAEKAEPAAEATEETPVETAEENSAETAEPAAEATSAETAEQEPAAVETAKDNQEEIVQDEFINLLDYDDIAYHAKLRDLGEEKLAGLTVDSVKNLTLEELVAARIAAENDADEVILKSEHLRRLSSQSEEIIDLGAGDNYALFNQYVEAFCSGKGKSLNKTLMPILEEIQTLRFEAGKPLLKFGREINGDDIDAITEELLQQAHENSSENENIVAAPISENINETNVDAGQNPEQVVDTAEPIVNETPKEPTVEEENVNNVLITPHYVNALQDFFALSEEKQKEQINRMTAKDLVDWYDELYRSTYGTKEYIPTAQQKDAFYNMAFQRVCELAFAVDENTAEQKDIENFFENVHIEYDDEWHKDMVVRMARQEMDISEAKKPYSKEEMRQHVYELAKEAAIQQVLEKYNGVLPDIDSRLVHEIRQAVLDQRQAICISMLETQISRDLVNMAKREKDANSGENAITTKEKARQRAKEIYDNLSSPRYKNARQRIARASMNLLGIASGQSVILQDSTIVSTIATHSVLIKAKAAELVDKFKETPVGKLFVKSKQRLDAFEAKLAKEHKYMNILYTSAKMFTVGTVIGAVGSPVATAAWIGYNVAKADKAFYNEYLKAKQTGEIKNIGQFLKKNPLQSGLTIASNVGAIIGLNNAAAGGVVRMATGAAGVFTSAAKDFAKGDWRMGLTKILTFGAGYAAGNSMHGSDSNTAQNNETSTEQTQTETSNVTQEVYDKAVKDVTNYAKNMKLDNISLEQETATEVQSEPQPQAESDAQNKTLYNAKIDDNVPTQDEIERVKEALKFVAPDVKDDNLTFDVSAQDNPQLVKDGQSGDYVDNKNVSLDVDVNKDDDAVGIPEPEGDMYVEQSPHAPDLDENGKITLLGGEPHDFENEDGITDVKIEQSTNGVVETEYGNDGRVVNERSLVVDADGNKHATITHNGETQYMSEAEEKHFIHNISVQHSVQEADANTAKLLNEIHGKPDIRDVEYKQWLAEHPEQDDFSNVKDTAMLHATQHNDSVGIDSNFQMREADGNIVTMANNGVCVYSQQHDVTSALVLGDDGKIHGYTINQGGEKTEITSARELSQHIAAVSQKMQGTPYQNSDFAHAAQQTQVQSQHQVQFAQSR